LGGGAGAVSLRERAGGAALFHNKAGSYDWLGHNFFDDSLALGSIFGLRTQTKTSE
jgi:hypothetical protein